MKTELAVRSLAQELLDRELERRLKRASQILPENCAHHHLQILDTRKNLLGCKNPDYNTLQNQTIGLCMYGSSDPETWSGTICEDVVDAQRCQYFTPVRNMDDITQKFQQDTQNPDWVESNMPHVWALNWVVDSDQILIPKGCCDNGGTAPSDVCVNTIHSIPWWKIIWMYLMRTFYSFWWL